MKSGYSIVWSDEASSNLDSIIEYLQNRWTDKEISRFFKLLEKRIGVLSQNPHAFPAVEFDSTIKRCVLSEQTSLFYQIQSDTIVILSLFDNRRNPDSLQL